MPAPLSGFLKGCGTWIAVCSFAAAQDPAAPSEAIHYGEIGKRFHIEGEFGKTYSDFEVRGTVLKPTGKGDANGRVRLEITHVRGARIEKSRIESVVADSKFVVGSKVVWLVREEARLWYPEGIDDVQSNPDTSHLHKLHCVVSLHLRKVLMGAEGKGPGEARPEAQSEPVAPSGADRVPD